MDLTTLMGALLSDNSVNSVAGKTGVSAGDVAGVLAAALPVMLNGANAQAHNADTSESFHEAVTEHAAKDPEAVDLAEGEKIVEHLLGDDEAKAEKAIAKKTGLSKAQVALILAALAPLIMNKLGQQTTASNSTSAANTASLLGALLGGGSNSSASNALMTAALGAVLSNALGGNSHASNNVAPSILGSVLGSSLGGSQPVQSTASAGTASLLGSLLGATQQPQVQVKPQHKPQQVQEESGSFDLLGGLLSLLK